MKASRVLRAFGIVRPDERLREYECGENNEDVLRYEKLLKNERVYDGKP